MEPVPAQRWWERVPPRVVDAALAAVMAVLDVALVAMASEEGAREPDALAYLLGLSLAVPVLARRRHPVGVLLVTWGLLTLYHVLSYPATGLAIPLSVALYSAAAAGHLRWALLAVVSQLAGGTGYRLLVEGEAPRTLLAGGSLLDAALMVALVLLGETVHSRRALAAEVRERLRRAEADRELQTQRRVEQERLRIARELHDVLAHTVAVIAVQAGVAADVLDESPREARAALAAIRSASREAMREVKATVGVLRDGEEAPLAPTPGLAQLDGLLAQAEGAGLRVDLAVAGQARPLPAALDLVAYRILQESLTNVLRHAGAEAVGVTIGYEPGAVVLSVADDGRGPPAAAPTPGHGLAGMRERAAALGGRLEAGPRPGRGFQVSAWLPVA